MRHIVALAVAGLLVTGTGCYHATIDTGRPASGQTIEKPWAASFIAGLVPPAVVETASKCPNGVSKVETKLSFLNQLAQFVTFGLYSPMTITVSCAAAGSASGDDAAEGAIEAGSTIEEQQAAIEQAAAQAAETGAAVLVQF